MDASGHPISSAATPISPYQNNLELYHQKCSKFNFFVWSMAWIWKCDDAVHHGFWRSPVWRQLHNKTVFPTKTSFSRKRWLLPKSRARAEWLICELLVVLLYIWSVDSTYRSQGTRHLLFISLHTMRTRATLVSSVDTIFFLFCCVFPSCYYVPFIFIFYSYLFSFSLFSFSLLFSIEFRGREATLEEITMKYA